MADEKKDKFHIRLHVYDHDLAVTINREDEEVYRKAGTLITEVVGAYMDYYKGLKSDKEILYMALVDIALRYEKEAVRNDVEPVSAMLEKLKSEIEETIGKA